MAGCFVCALVCLSVYASIRGRNTLDMCPNTLRQCLFNHNLGLHESTNGKQTGLAGKLDMESSKRRGGCVRGKDECRGN